MSNDYIIQNMRARLEKSMPYLAILRPAAEDKGQTARESPKTLHRKGGECNEKDQR